MVAAPQNPGLPHTTIHVAFNPGHLSESRAFFPEAETSHTQSERPLKLVPRTAMRTFMALLAVVMVTASAVAYDDSRCGGRYSGYPDWAQDPFCKPPYG